MSDVPDNEQTHGEGETMETHHVVNTAHDIYGRLIERASSAVHGHCEFCAVDLTQFGHGNDCVVHLLDDAVDEIRRLRGEMARLGAFLHPIGEQARRG